MNQSLPPTVADAAGASGQPGQNEQSTTQRFNLLGLFAEHQNDWSATVNQEDRAFAPQQTQNGFDVDRDMASPQEQFALKVQSQFNDPEWCAKSIAMQTYMRNVARYGRVEIKPPTEEAGMSAFSYLGRTAGLGAVIGVCSVQAGSWLASTANTAVTSSGLANDATIAMFGQINNYFANNPVILTFRVTMTMASILSGPLKDPRKTNWRSLREVVNGQLREMGGALAGKAGAQLLGDSAIYLLGTIWGPLGPVGVIIVKTIFNATSKQLYKFTVERLILYDEAAFATLAATTIAKQEIVNQAKAPTTAAPLLVSQTRLYK